MSKKQTALRLIIFGCGSSGERAFRALSGNHTIVGFSDNNEAIHGTEFNGVPVYAPTEIPQLDYDRIYLASMYFEEIRTQLIVDVGIDAQKIDHSHKYLLGAMNAPVLKMGDLRGYMRKAVAQYRYDDYFGFQSLCRSFMRLKEGYQRKLAALKNHHYRCPVVLLAPGSSIQQLDPQAIAKFVVITCNGSYQYLNDHGIEPDYHIIEDRNELKRRSQEWSGMKTGVKMTSLENADLVKATANTLFFKTNRHPLDSYFWNDLPRPFSRDFATVAYMGGTILYVMLQLAYHLGANPIILLGVDHTYGKLIEALGVKVTPANRSFEVTKANAEIFSRFHFGKQYFRIGERINLPSIDEQESALQHAAEVFQGKGVEVINANPDSGLPVFEKRPWQSVLQQYSP